MPPRRVSDQFRLVAMTARRLARPPAGSARGSRLIPDVTPATSRLALAPRDIRTADPTVAVDIYAGLFTFAGRSVQVGGASPFLLEPPSEAWARELHGFAWLGHLRAAETELTRSNGRALVDEWLRTGRRLPRIAWEPTVAARRLMSWLSQSALLLKGCDQAFYERFMRAIDRHVAGLSAVVERTPEGLPRLTIAIALLAAAVSIADQPRLVRRALRRLEREFAAQILPDGGHVSRNPAALLDILVDLLPVRQALAVRGVVAPARIGEAIDRMMPMLRFFRHDDGAFAYFNGAGATPRGLVATVLAYDDARGQPPAFARYSLYQRIDAEIATLIMDVGPAPPLRYSGRAHAGCLSFEFSTGPNRIIVNCGALDEANPDWRAAARATAAHSTVVVEDRSSARIVDGRVLKKRLGALLYDGPTHVEVRRVEEHDRAIVVASHDGYQKPLGVLHERTIALGRDGTALSGRDQVIGRDGIAFCARFHLHPAIRVRHADGERGAELTVPDGSVWRFEVDSGQTVGVEESVYLVSGNRARRTAQLVVRENSSNADAVRWHLVRVREPAQPIRRLAEIERVAAERERDLI